MKLVKSTGIEKLSKFNAINVIMLPVGSNHTVRKCIDEIGWIIHSSTQFRSDIISL